MSENNIYNLLNVARLSCRSKFCDYDAIGYCAINMFVRVIKDFIRFVGFHSWTVMK